MDERQQRLNKFGSLMSAFADPVDEIIYHYTSAEGLRGIIENREIWLTNTAFVNDTTECRALQGEKELFNDKDFTNKNVKNSWNNYISDVIRNYIYSDSKHVTYIASFSKAKASLAQYRAYGNFCLGFDASKLKSPNSNLYQCVYGNEEIKSWILKKEKVEEWGGDGLDDQCMRVAAFNLIHAASRKYKSKHFENEEEVRLISVSNHSWKNYPESSSMFAKDPPIYYRDHLTYKIPIPYVKYFIRDDMENNQDKVWDWDETYGEMKERKLRDEKDIKRDFLPIKEILIGPMLHQKEAEIACKILLSDMEYQNVEVKALDIPYRGF